MGPHRRIACGYCGGHGHGHSAAEESFAEGHLEYPQFTRPQVFEGRPIPEVLTRDHAKVAAWRAPRGGDRAAHTRATARPLVAAYQARAGQRRKPRRMGDKRARSVVEARPTPNPQSRRAPSISGAADGEAPWT